MEISQIKANINLIKIELDEQKYLSGYKKIEETWNCVNKSGKKIQNYMNTITGKLKFT